MPRHPATPAGPSRRTVLRLMGAAGGATAMTLSGARVAFADGTDGQVMVVLTLRGGFDGLGAVAPVGDDDYATARPTLAVGHDEGLQLDDTFSLHPALQSLGTLWDAGTFGVVHAAGQSGGDRSHVSALAALDRAAAEGVATGWIDRAVGADDGSGLTGTRLGSPLLPGAMVGTNTEVTARTLDDLSLAVSDSVVPLSGWRKALASVHTGSSTGYGTRIGTALTAVQSERSLGSAGSATDAGYPDSELGQALHDVAGLVTGGTGLRVAAVTCDGWDTHRSQGATTGTFATRLTDLAAALTAFATELGDALDRTTLVTVSEFGRTVAENGSAGTDHGSGTAMLLVGGGVAGGQVLGEWPGLSSDALDDGGLAVTTDYRQVLAEVAHTRLGLPVATVFPGLSLDALGVVEAP